MITHTPRGQRMLQMDGYRYVGTCTGCSWWVGNKRGNDELAMSHRAYHKVLLAAAGSVLSGQRENCSDPPNGGVGSELPSAASGNTP